MAHLGEHGDRVAAGQADGALHAGTSARRNGLVAFSSPSSEGTVASPLARAASIAAERLMSLSLSASTVTANRAFDCVYSCAQ